MSWPAAVPLAQALHHADDHRTHVLSILGAHGLEAPRLDVGLRQERRGGDGDSAHLDGPLQHGHTDALRGE